MRSTESPPESGFAQQREPAARAFLFPARPIRRAAEDVGLAFACLCLVVGCESPDRSPPPVTIETINHRGWADSYRLRNDQVEAVVVPAVGRVMQFGFRGELGVLWENPALAGGPIPTKPWDSPGSFGGDKTWPAPQRLWGWPPPAVFDAIRLAPKIEEGVVTLVSPTDPNFGIRTLRHISLAPTGPVLRIVTTYEKLYGKPVDLSVWVITQLQEPAGVFIPVPAKSRFPDGFSRQADQVPSDLRVDRGLVSLTRRHDVGTKIGSDAGALLWVGDKCALRIDAPVIAGGSYPDQGCSVEVYTNPDPAAYVELETLGPLRRLSVGDRISATNTYTLSRRSQATAEAEARALLAR